MMVYEGKPPGHVVVVDIDRGIGRPLRHREKHSPDGFSWGYEGSGCADLARSILWDVLGEEPYPAAYHDFKREFVANWPTDESWALSISDINAWVEAWRKGAGTPLPHSRRFATVREYEEAARV